MVKNLIRISRAGILNKESAFTLIELCVVIVLFSISFGLIFPLMDSGLVKNDFKTSIRHLQAVTNEFRNYATLHNSMIGLVIDLSEDYKDKGHAYWLEKKSRTTQVPSKDKKYLFNGDIQLLAIQNKGGPIQTSGLAKIRFSPQGLVEPTYMYISDNRVNYKLSIQPFDLHLQISQESNLELW